MLKHYSFLFGKHFGARESVLKTVTVNIHGHVSMGNRHTSFQLTSSDNEARLNYSHSQIYDVPILWVFLRFASLIFSLVDRIVWFANASWVAPQGWNVDVGPRNDAKEPGRRQSHWPYWFQVGRVNLSLWAWRLSCDIDHLSQPSVYWSSVVGGASMTHKTDENRVTVPVSYMWV